MDFTRITTEGFLEEFKNIHEQMPDRPFCWVLGSGASAQSKIPTGSTLVDEWLRFLHENKKAQEKRGPIEQWATAENLGIPGFEYERRADFYPWVYHRRFEHFKDQGYAFLEKAMEGAEPSFGYSVLAQIMATTQHKVAITTNFDNLVADALSIYARTSPLVCGHESLTGYVRANVRRPLVAKIHRDLLLGPLSDPDDIAKLPEEWAAALRTILERFIPIVIGYGGNDGSLMGFLRELPPMTMFWCHRSEADISPNIQEVVERHRGTFVPIAGFDEVMLLLQNKLRLPSLLPVLKKVSDQRVEAYQEQFKALRAALEMPAENAEEEETRQPLRAAAEATLERWKKAERRKNRVRLTSHKARSRWFQARSSWPVREASVNTLVRERRNAQKRLASAKTAEAEWECVGPYNTGGRVTSIVCHPKHPKRLWLGAAGGGVWHSADGGRKWKSCWNDQDILNIGSLAIDPHDPDIIYCGTGEANLSSDCYPGVGLYRSIDAGRSWKLHASSNDAGVPRGIGVIAIDPFDSKHLLIGGVGFAEVSAEEDSLGGLYTSKNGGVKWKRETFISDQNYWCHSIVFHPTKRGVVFATFTEQGSRSGIWRSVNSGRTWHHLTAGLVDSALFGRTSLAISLSKPEVMYAFAADESSESSDLMLGVFRSSDGGDNWRKISKTHFDDEGQISYNNTIAVHPTDHNYVICGGVDLHLTKDGGNDWRRVTRWDAERGESNYAHSDHHCVLMPAAAPGLVYDANDGGLDVSEDGGRKWKNRSNGLAITMFYDLDVAPTNGAFFGGGAQDNGTVITKTGDADKFEQIYEGDGGWLVFDPNDENHLYCSCYNLDIRMYRGKRHRNVSPPASPAEQGSIWMCYITLDPANPKRVFTGSYRVWASNDDGATWRVISPPLSTAAR